MDLINQLKQKREELSQAESQIDDIYQQLQLTDTWQAYEQAKAYKDTIKEEINILDTRIRIAATDEYIASDNKEPFPGVKVILRKFLVYDELRAITWCKENALGMLKLDRRQFEKHAKAVSETMPLDFVEVDEVPMVRIAKEL